MDKKQNCEKIPLQQQETIICVDYFSKRVSVYSNYPACVRYFSGLAKDNEDQSTVFQSDGNAIEVQFPAKWFKPRQIRPPKTKTMSQEQKRSLIQRMSKAKKGKQNE